MDIRLTPEQVESLCQIDTCTSSIPRRLASSCCKMLTNVPVSDEVGGLKVKPGDLLHGDRQDLISVPLQIAQDIPAVAAHLREIDQKIIAVC